MSEEEEYRKGVSEVDTKGVRPWGLAGSPSAQA